MSVKPYSGLKILEKYVIYFFKSKSRHSVHSPLIYKFVEDVLYNKKTPKYDAIEAQRTAFKRNTELISFTDFGKNGIVYKKSVKSIAKKSLKTPKYAKLIARSITFFEAKSILELGTSLGISTAYMAKSTQMDVVTLEGDKNVADIAKQMWNKLELFNIKPIIGDFGNTLEPILREKNFDLIYLDGNHKLKPTLAYFDLILSNQLNTSVLIFDDIHYSSEMEQAWSSIKKHPKVKCTIDVFFLGYVLLNFDITPNHYVLRF